MNKQSKQMVANNWMNLYNQNPNSAISQATKAFAGFSEKLANLLRHNDAKWSFRKAIEASLS